MENDILNHKRDSNAKRDDEINSLPITSGIESYKPEIY